MYCKSGVVALLLAGAATLAAGADTDRLHKAQEHLRNNRYQLAAEALADLRAQADAKDEPTRATALLGIAHFHMHHYGPAREFLHQALHSPSGATAGSPGERARWTATLAELEANDGKLPEARRQFELAVQLAKPDPDTATGIRLSRLASLPGERKFAALQAEQIPVQAIRDPADRMQALSLLGTQARQLGPEGTRLAFESLSRARDLAIEPRARAEILGQLAQLYEDRRRWSDAARLNNEALAQARPLAARDLLLELDWRAGRLARADGQTDTALAAYQRAVDDIEAIRPDIPVEYREGRSSFRETLEPVYLGLADLLLTEAARRAAPERKDWLRRARATVELIKQAELDDFLGGRCTVQSTRMPLLDRVAAQTAVLYPIILPDRLELLASVGEDLRQSTRPIPAEPLRDLVKRLAHSLRMRRDDAKPLARELYTWLLQPLEPWLREQGVQTLVIVPDGALRLIPLAALHDGEHYLIERYALATSPGLTLLNPTPLARTGVKALLAGLSEPGPVIDQLPPAFLQGLLEEAGAPIAAPEGIESGLAGNERRPRGRGSRALPWSAAALPAKDVLQDPELRARIKDQLKLPGVVEEIDKLQTQVPHTRLLDADFTAEALRNGLAREPYGIVHIASHGVFGHSAEASFIMAYDQVLSLNELEALLRSQPFRDHPIELLTLSACQTAEGDDRAPLGITGVALKTRVRGALGSLWPVDDEAAANLMPKFYAALAAGSTSKVAALRDAQLALLHDPELAHPYFWAPFILVGNWL